jgi:hypothetical protein
MEAEATNEGREAWQCAVCEHWWPRKPTEEELGYERYSARVETVIAGRVVTVCSSCQSLTTALRTPRAFTSPKCATVREWLPPWAWNAMSLAQAAGLEHVLDDLEFNEVRVRLWDEWLPGSSAAERARGMSIEFHGLSIEGAAKLSRIGGHLIRSSEDEYKNPLAMAISVSQVQTAQVTPRAVTP